MIELSIVILIIGVLIAAVGQGIDLLQDTRLTAARMILQSSKVSSISGLVMWIDATSDKAFITSEIDGDTASISAWYDVNQQSISKNNFLQSTLTSKPTYKANVINGLPVVSFDGVNDYMSTEQSDQSSGFFNNGDYTIFFVTKIGVQNQPTAIMFQYLLWPNLSSYDRNCGLEINTNSLLKIDGGSALIAKGSGDVTNQNLIISGYRDSTNLASYVNGASYSSATGTGSPSFSGKFNIGMHIRGDATGNRYPTKMDVGEVIIYGRALKSKERKSVEAYLSKKWSVKVAP